MAKAVQVTISGQKELLARLAKYSGEVKKNVARELQNAADEVADNASLRLSRNDTGLLQNSISSKKIDELSYEVIANQFYAPYIEFGTGKKFDAKGRDAFASQYRGKDYHDSGSFDDFVKRLTKWVISKQLVGTYSIKTKQRSDRGKVRAQQDSEAEVIAERIATYIIRFGQKAHPFLFPALVEEQAKLIDRLKQKYGFI